jgi:hypothetical protein
MFVRPSWRSIAARVLLGVACVLVPVVASVVVELALLAPLVMLGIATGRLLPEVAPSLSIVFGYRQARSADVQP